MAIGSRRTTPVCPTLAAVVSDAIDAATSTPCCQLRASYTSGATSRLRPPNTSAEMGTPCGSSERWEYEGLRFADTVKRKFGWSAGRGDESKGRPCQSMAGLPLERPSHQGSLSAVNATLVKRVSRRIMSYALRLVSGLVPGTTPK